MVEAEANANKLGGHLVTINDAEENQWLVDQYYGDGKLSDKVPHLLIGFSDKEEEGIWNWQSGQDPTYTNWRSGEPDGTSTYKAGENYSLFWIHDNYNTDPGQWGDIDNKGGWINEYHYGIAEIKIPFVNQDPTGTPLLTGDFIPGEIENAMQKFGNDLDLLIIEGQGAINNALYSGVTSTLKNPASSYLI